MRIRYMLAALAAALPLVATGCGTTCGHHGGSCCGSAPAVARSVPVVPAPAPCCNGAGPAPIAPGPVQQSYSIPVFPSNGVRK
jgi:hypothetical protein